MVLEKNAVKNIETIFPDNSDFQKYIPINPNRACDCKINNLNCMTAKEWVKAQLGVWQFNYESRDIRDKSLHPATFPISLSKKVISLFSHKGEYVLDPFTGSGTTQLAAQDLDRNSIGFDLNKEYVELVNKRLIDNSLLNITNHYIIQDDSININKLLRF